MISSIRNLLVDLREGTDAGHRRVEKHPLLLPLMSTTLSVEQYSRVIAAFTGFYEAVERRMSEMSSPANFPGYRYAPRLPLLVEDRAALPTCPVTPCTVVPAYSRDEELIGVLYVLEGATQGGRVIAPRVQQKLALTDSAGARYFNFYHQDSWWDFRAMVERCQMRLDCTLAVAAAQATFDHLHAHLDHCLSHSGD